MKVLIVEDSRRLRESLVDGLRRLGFAVDAADNGEDGLRLARTHAYDVVVLDLMLPGFARHSNLPVHESRRGRKRL